MEKLETAKEEDVCVDTDILVDFLRKREPGFSSYGKHRTRSKILISSVSAFELSYGANLSSNREKRISEVQSILQNHPVAPFDSASASSAAEIAADLRSKGESIEIRDLFNASICLSRQVPILTRNKSHYQRVEGLRLISP